MLDQIYQRTVEKRYDPGPILVLLSIKINRIRKSGVLLIQGDERQIKGSGGFMIGEREGAWLVCHWVGGGTRRKGGRPAEFTSEIANMNTNEILNCV